MLLSVYLPTLLISFCSGLLLPVMPLYAKSFHASYGLVGVMLAGDGIGNLVCDVPAGVLMRRIGRKQAMLIGIGCEAFSVLALTWAGSFLEVMIYRFVAGAGDSLWSISRHAYIADVTQVRERGRAIAMFGGLGRLGMFSGPGVGGAVAARFGLRVPFWMFAILAGVAFAVAALFIHEPRAASLGGVDRKGRLRAVLRGHYRDLTVAGSAQVFAQMIRAGRHVIIPIYAADVIGLDVRSVGLVLSFSAALDMAMFYPAGWIMDRFGRKYASVPSFLVQALGMALVPLSGSFWTLLAATSVLGLGNGIGSGTMMTLGADLAPRESRGEFLGVWRLIGDAGGAGGPLAVGSVAQAFGLRAAACTLAGVGVLAVLILALYVRETLHEV